MGITRTPQNRKMPARRTGEVVVRSLKGAPTDADQDEDLVSVLSQRSDQSKQIADPFKSNSLYDGRAGASDFRVVPPPMSVSALLRMPNDNSILRQCIEAMVINTEGHGYRLEYVGPDGEEDSDAAKQEKEHIEEFLESLHPELSLTEIRKRVRWDVESLGFGYIEILRDKAGLPIGLTHVPAHTMRVTNVDMEEVEVPVEGKRFGKAPVKTTVKRRFRRYLQLIGTEKVWFKEYGDPRTISPVTGQSDPNVAFEDSATEIIMVKQYTPGQIYGTPRWLNNLVAIQGSRQAELTNLDYFKENAIPALAVLVSGGFLHDETMTQIEEHLTAARGRQAQNRVLVLEVQGDEAAASRDGAIPQPRVDIKPLAGERPNEGQFLAYDKDQTDKVRSSFRLPPIFTGHAQDYNLASAKTSHEVAEGQVFGPERQVQDDIINRQMLKPYDVKFWEVRSNPPRIADPEEIIKAIEMFEKSGAMTPNVAIGLANEQFGLDIPSVEEEWGKLPFSIVSELGKQGKLVGAFEKIVKEIDMAGMFGDDPGDEDEDGKKPPVPGNENDKAPPKDPQEAASKTIRRSMRTLRDVLETASRTRYNPPARTAPAKKAA